MQLFKNKNGKIRSWRTWTEDSTLFEEYGLIDGKKVISSKVRKPKNIGKSNETTGSEQAISEMNSNIKSKMDEGYFTTVEEATNNIVILPMLANDFKKTKNIDWSNAFAQPKFDGMRCLADIDYGKVTLYSRKGIIIDTLPHIEKELSKIKGKMILDGEIYSMELGSFQEQMKAVKKYREGITEKLNFNVYDMISDKPFYERTSDLYDILIDFDDNSSIKGVTTYLVNEKDLPEFHKEFLADGYEGTMVRYGEEGYKMDTRSKNLLKYKDFIDITAVVTDVVPSDARPEQGILVCSLADGGEFRASLKMSHAEREEILTNKEEYIGQTAEIRFFEYTDEGKPRFPVCVGFRLDK